MAQHLTANVVLRHPDTGAVVVLESGSELPSWAVGRVGKHILDGSPAQELPTRKLEPSLNPAPAVAASPPPRSGRGATDEAWTVYARTQGVAVTDSMSRREVIEACEKSGVPT